MGVVKELNHITFDEFERMNEISNDTLEYLNGQIYALARPSRNHQRVARRLIRILEEHFESKKCEPFIEVDVKLVKEGLADYLVVPDIIVTCDEEKWTEQRYEGVPTFIIEILSPSNQRHDTVFKKNLYSKFGVKEYWIVNPLEKTIEINNLHESGCYMSTKIVDAEYDKEVNSTLFEDLMVNLEYLFDY